MSLLANHESRYIQEKNSPSSHVVHCKGKENFYRRFLIGNNSLTKRSLNKNFIFHEPESKREEGGVFYHRFNLN